MAVIAMGPQGDLRDLCLESLTSEGRVAIRAKDEAAAAVEKARRNSESSILAKFGLGKHTKAAEESARKKAKEFQEKAHKASKEAREVRKAVSQLCRFKPLKSPSKRLTLRGKQMRWGKEMATILPKRSIGVQTIWQ